MAVSPFVERSRTQKRKKEKEKENITKQNKTKKKNGYAAIVSVYVYETYCIFFLLT